MNLCACVCCMWCLIIIFISSIKLTVWARRQQSGTAIVFQSIKRKIHSIKAHSPIRVYYISITARIDNLRSDYTFYGYYFATLFVCVRRQHWQPKAFWAAAPSVGSLAQLSCKSLRLRALLPLLSPSRSLALSLSRSLKLFSLVVGSLSGAAHSSCSPSPARQTQLCRRRNVGCNTCAGLNKRPRPHLSPWPCPLNCSN